MKALKVSVILMGVLILVGLAVVAITVARRANRPAPPAPPPAEVSHAVAPPIAGVPSTGAPAAGQGPAGFGQVTVNYPADFEPVETVADGDRLIVRFKSAAGTGRIVVLDMKSGRVLGTVTLAPEAP